MTHTRMIDSRPRKGETLGGFPPTRSKPGQASIRIPPTPSPPKNTKQLPEIVALTDQSSTSPGTQLVVAKDHVRRPTRMNCCSNGEPPTSESSLWCCFKAQRQNPFSKTMTHTHTHTLHSHTNTGQGLPRCQHQGAEQQQPHGDPHAAEASA